MKTHSPAWATEVLLPHRPTHTHRENKHSNTARRKERTKYSTSALDGRGHREDVHHSEAVRLAQVARQQLQATLQLLRAVGELLQVLRILWKVSGVFSDHDCSAVLTGSGERREKRGDREGEERETERRDNTRRDESQKWRVRDCRGV